MSLLSKLHLARKGFHASIGPLVMWIYWMQFHPLAVALALLLLLTPLAILEYLRLGSSQHRPRLNQAFMAATRLVIRRSEAHRVNSTVHFLVGAILSLLFFPRDNSAISILMLCFADPMASLVGVSVSHWSARTPSTKGIAAAPPSPSPSLSHTSSHYPKSVAGTVACWGAGALTAWFFLVFLFDGTSATLSPDLHHCVSSLQQHSLLALPCISLACFCGLCGVAAALSESATTVLVYLCQRACPSGNLPPRGNSHQGDEEATNSGAATPQHLDHSEVHSQSDSHQEQLSPSRRRVAATLLSWVLLLDDNSVMPVLGCVLLSLVSHHWLVPHRSL